MERFIVSARKYRPDNFESLIGQENIATTLKNSVVRKQLAHAYLFCGPRGVGKTSAARIFAKTINCYNPGEQMEPCGQCESCISFSQGRSYSIHELDAASNNSVEDIRQLNELVRIPPQIGTYSVYIIDEVHMLSQSAFNAFLKTLEEPPAHAIFILATTEKHKILPTILSRCQTYDFNRISVPDIVKNLTSIAQKEGIECEIDALHIIAQKADGAMRDALTIFDQAVAFCGSSITYDNIISSLNVLDYDYYIKITGYFLNGDYTNSLLLFDEILSRGFNSLHFIGGLSNHFRDLLICKDKSTIPLLELAPSLRDKYIEQSQLCTIPFLYDALSISSMCESGYKMSGHPRLHIEIALLKLCAANTPAWINEKTQAPAQATAKTPASASAPASAPAPAPMQAPTVPAPAPSSPSQDSATASSAKNSFSIKNLMKSAEEKGKAVKKVKTREIGSEPINHEKLLEVWSKMAIQESSLPRLSTTISQTKPYVKENNTIYFPVKNELQKKWIEDNCISRLVEFLRINLNNKEVKLQIEVTPDDDSSENKMYMPHEKAKFLIEKYPEVKGMKDDLNLELK